MDDNKPKMIDVKIASEPWVMEQIMDAERRTEKSFHEQTKYLKEGLDRISAGLHDQTKYLAEQQAIANGSDRQTDPNPSVRALDLSANRALQQQFLMRLSFDPRFRANPFLTGR